MLIRLCGVLLLVLALASKIEASPPRPSVVKVEKTATGFRLVRNGQPYLIKGGGGSDYLETLKEAGGNSIRTWGGDNLEPLMDRAQELGLAVTFGIWLGQPRQGFNYHDAASVQRQFETVRGLVRKYRNFPALLVWGLGNEMEGAGDDPVIWRAVNDIARMVKQEDPGHPTMTVIAEIGGHKAQQFEALCPDVDILGINSYAGAPSLVTRLKKDGFHHPFIVTEFGPPGTWEVGKTPWGAPPEPTSTRKAEMYRRAWESFSASPQFLGGYAFDWGHKQEATATWFGMLLPSGETVGAVDAMTHVWTGKWPANRAPALGRIELSTSPQSIKPGQSITARAIASDPDGDRMMVRWEVRSESNDRRSGGDPEQAPLAHPECHLEWNGLGCKFHAPDQEGAYRLFVYVYDGKGHAATGNLPFLVARL